MGKRGFSLMELMIYMAVFGIVIMILPDFSASIRRVNRTIDKKMSQEQSLRMAMRRIERDLRMATLQSNSDIGLKGLAILPYSPGTIVQFQVPTSMDADSWSTLITYRRVTQEDLDGDGILDEGEDRDSDGILDADLGSSVGVLVRQQDKSDPPDGDVFDEGETLVIADHMSELVFSLDGDLLYLTVTSLKTKPDNIPTSRTAQTMVRIRNT